MTHTFLTPTGSHILAIEIHEHEANGERYANCFPCDCCGLIWHRTSLRCTDDGEVFCKACMENVK